jgi:hypothetical protein
MSFSPLRPQIATRQPSSKNSFAAAKPIPSEPPVMTATFSFNCKSKKNHSFYMTGS